MINPGRYYHSLANRCFKTEIKKLNIKQTVEKDLIDRLSICLLNENKLNIKQLSKHILESSEFKEIYEERDANTVIIQIIDTALNVLKSPYIFIPFIETPIPDGKIDIDKFLLEVEKVCRGRNYLSEVFVSIKDKYLNNTDYTSAVGETENKIIFYSRELALHGVNPTYEHLRELYIDILYIIDGMISTPIVEQSKHSIIKMNMFD